TPLVNQLFTYNALSNQVFDLALSARYETRSLIPKNEAEFLKMDYQELCTSPVTALEIDADRFNELIANENAEVVDVRELHELPEVNEFPNKKIPLSQLANNTNEMRSNILIVFCQTGKRSFQAVKILHSIFGGSKRIYSLQGGILEWKKQNQTV